MQSISTKSGSPSPVTHGHQIINDNLQTSQTDIELVSENETALGHDDGEKVPSRQNKK